MFWHSDCVSSRSFSFSFSNMCGGIGISWALFVLELIVVAVLMFAFYAGV